MTSVNTNNSQIRFQHDCRLTRCGQLYFMRHLNKAREVVILTYCPLPKCLFVLLRIRTGGCPLGTESDNFEAIYYQFRHWNLSCLIDWLDLWDSSRFEMFGFKIFTDLSCGDFILVGFLWEDGWRLWAPNQWRAAGGVWVWCKKMDPTWSNIQCILRFGCTIPN